MRKPDFESRRLQPTALIDAGGHVGVTYRAVRLYLDRDRIDWIVYDLPAQVRAGQNELHTR